MVEATRCSRFHHACCLLTPVECTARILALLSLWFVVGVGLLALPLHNRMPLDEWQSLTLQAMRLRLEQAATLSWHTRPRISASFGGQSCPLAFHVLLPQSRSGGVTFAGGG